MLAMMIARLLTQTYVEPEIVERMSAGDMGRFLLPLLKLQSGGFTALEVLGDFDRFSDFPHSAKFRVRSIMCEGMNWLTATGLIARDLESVDRDAYFVTRAGRDIDDMFDYDTQVRLARFPYDSMHPLIAREAQAQMERREFGSAVADVYKCIETSVRELETRFCMHRKSQFKDIAYNVFKTIGVITNRSKDTDALAQILTSAYSLYRNPVSHQTSKLDYEQAFDALSVASAVTRRLDDLVEQATMADLGQLAVAG